jgi:histidinol-phosphate aminotransferase
VVEHDGAHIVNSYPDSGPLYRKLARQIGLSPRHLLLAPGSDGVIRAVFDSLVEEGDGVLHTAPTFAMYPVYCQMRAAKVTTLAYQSSAEGPQLGVAAIVDALARVRPRLLCLPNPDSPTGTVFAAHDLRAVIEAAASHRTWVLIDEAYHPFHSESVASWVDECPNLIVARTFAKAWGMAGLRIGYAIANPEVVPYLHKVRPMYEVSTLAVAVTERMLDHEDEMIGAVARLNDGRDWFVSEMRSRGFQALQSHGNFCHVRFGDDGGTPRCVTTSCIAPTAAAAWPATAVSLPRPATHSRRSSSALPAPFPVRGFLP